MTAVLTPSTDDTSVEILGVVKATDGIFYNVEVEIIHNGKSLKVALGTDTTDLASAAEIARKKLLKFADGIKSALKEEGSLK